MLCRRQIYAATDDDGFKLISSKKNPKKGAQLVIWKRKGSWEQKVTGGRLLPVFISRLNPTVSVHQLSVNVKTAIIDYNRMHRRSVYTNCAHSKL